MRDTLIKAYLAYLNNYLTVEKYAENNGLTVAQANIVLNLGRELFNSKHPDA